MSRTMPPIDQLTEQAVPQRGVLFGRLAFAAYVALLLAASWRRWGDPVSDVGLDLTVAAHWSDGLVPYRDLRYWYGPLGIGTLTATFGLFGATLWTAVATGLAITGGIAELSRRIARRWLDPLPALAASAVVLSIAFSGTLFDFVLPHTFAATTGLLALLAAILALTHGRYAVAGVAIGATALARPEFFAFGLAALGGAALGQVRASGVRDAAAGVVRAVAVAALVALPPYLWLAQLAGAHRLLLENIWPVEFLRAVGGTFEHDQHPFDLPSLGTLLVRGAALVGGTWLLLRLAALLLSRGRDRGGRDRVTGGEVEASGEGKREWWMRSGRVVGTLTAVGLLGLVLAAAGGDPGQPLRLLRADLTRLVIAMTPLAAVGLATLGWGAICWWRAAPPPLQDGEHGPGWVAAGALIAVASACSLRSYAIFSTDVYASYYAPPVVIVAAILVVRLARRVTLQPLLAASAVLALGAASLTAHAIIGFYRDKQVLVTTPVGSFKSNADGDESVRRLLDALIPRATPGERLLAMPQEPGFLFLTRTRPALYNATFLPGVLATPQEDQAAARALIDGSADGPVAGYRPPRFVVEGVWNFAQWGFRAQGVDVNVALHRAVTEHYRVIGRFGDTDHIPPPYTLGHAFVLYELR
ncbi:MAG: hypothetical protein QM679_04795 [Patulibacter sp.]